MNDDRKKKLMNSKSAALNPVTKRLKDYLSQLNYREVFHEPAATCELSAKARGMDIKYGAKTVIFKHTRGFALFVLSAAKQIDSHKVRKILKSQRLRFAHEDEFTQLTQTTKGALPPFGYPVTDLPIFLDDSIKELDYICFNAGVLTHSIILEGDDYRGLFDNQYYSFSK